MRHNGITNSQSKRVAANPTAQRGPRKVCYYNFEELQSRSRRAVNEIQRQMRHFSAILPPPSTAVASHEQVFSASEKGTDRQDHGVSQGEWGRRRGEAIAEAWGSLAFSRGRNTYSNKNAVLKTNT